MPASSIISPFFGVVRAIFLGLEAVEARRNSHLAQMVIQDRTPPGTVEEELS